MYFYRKKQRSGQQVLLLLESYRDVSGRARNRVVVSLGSAEIDRDAWGEVSDLVEDRLYRQQSLLKASSPDVADWVESLVGRIKSEGEWTPLADKQVTTTPGDPCASASTVLDDVLVDLVSHTHSTTLGPELVGLYAWRKLGLDRLLAGLGFSSSQRAAACVSVINRLVDPVSEHGLLSWLPTSSLNDLLGEGIQSSDDQYYRISDKLLDHQNEVEDHLRQCLAQHFGFQRTLILYDLTNSHFEGVCANNEKALRGANKQKRFDCPQLVVGVCFDEYGFVLFHQTYCGNTHDAKTLEGMILDLEKRSEESADLPSDSKPLLIMDAGIATDANLSFLQEKGYRYLINIARKSRAAYFEEFQNLDGFELVTGKREGTQAVQIRKIANRDGSPGHTLLCRSEGRRQKEKAILSRSEAKLLADLDKLIGCIQKGRLKNIEKIHRRIGVIQNRHGRAMQYYQVDLTTNPEPKLTYERVDEKYLQAQKLTGCYVLKTNHAADFSGQELWTLYMSLTTAEAGFKALKSDLGLRPFFHQGTERCDGHVLITILAYQLQRFITYTLETKGDRRTWQTLRRVLQTHCYATIDVPTRHDGVTRLRKPGIPETCQKEIYRALGIDLNALPRTKKTICPMPATL